MIAPLARAMRHLRARRAALRSRIRLAEAAGHFDELGAPAVRCLWDWPIEHTRISALLDAIRALSPDVRPLAALDDPDVLRRAEPRLDARLSWIERHLDARDDRLWDEYAQALDLLVRLAVAREREDETP